MSKRTTPAVAHQALREYVAKAAEDFRELNDQVAVARAKWQGAAEALEVYENALGQATLKSLNKQKAA